ncbi:uncharacterized protein A4U43_C05F8480 [Asparagus officinalis]|uniref:Uncharacterized protein n=1 Tax=Asparagus officinalis TaxID=4686 RepID=A0A5P1EQ80_ASPOF|nr:uncharacterized protein A4U43_C05F8480 [Asparagus officinalis]
MRAEQSVGKLDATMERAEGAGVGAVDELRQGSSDGRGSDRGAWVARFGRGCWARRQADRVGARAARSGGLATKRRGGNGIGAQEELGQRGLEFNTIVGGAAEG